MVARMMIAVSAVLILIEQIDSYGFIRLFIPRIPSTPFILSYKKNGEKGISLFELVSIEYPVAIGILFDCQGDPVIRYYYAELSAFGFHLNDMQKKSIAWLLSELNECVVSHVRTQAIER